MKVLLFIWQLPQNLLGLIIKSTLKAEKDTWNDIEYYNGKLNGAVSLGNYIIIDKRYYNDDKTIYHEKGHQIQSKYLGWFYLIIIGIPSGLGNLIHRLFRFDYYKLPWEKWADKLGKVERY